MKNNFVCAVVVLVTFSCSKKAAVKPVADPTINVEVKHPQQDRTTIYETVNGVGKSLYNDVPPTSDFNFKFQAPAGAFIIVSSGNLHEPVLAIITISKNGNVIGLGASYLSLTVQ